MLGTIQFSICFTFKFRWMFLKSTFNLILKFLNMTVVETTNALKILSKIFGDTAKGLILKACVNGQKMFAEQSNGWAWENVRTPLQMNHGKPSSYLRRIHENEAASQPFYRQCISVLWIFACTMIDYPYIGHPVVIVITDHIRSTREGRSVVPGGEGIGSDDPWS